VHGECRSADRPLLRPTLTGANGFAGQDRRSRVCPAARSTDAPQARALETVVLDTRPASAGARATRSARRRALRVRRCPDMPPPWEGIIGLQPWVM
jgi:hypothetical protein